MNIIYVGDCGPSQTGAPISCDQLTRALARRGWGVRVLAPMLTSGDETLVAFDRARPEVEMRHYPVPAYFQDPFDRPPAEWAALTQAGVEDGLERLIAESRPDAMLVRELWLTYANPVAIRHDVPVVAMVRGNPTTAILSGVFPADLEERFLRELRQVERIVTVARHFLPGLDRLGMKRVSCIQNAIDVRRFTPNGRNRALAERLHIADSDVVALHAGTIKPIKRSLDIVRSAPEVLRRNPRVVFLIVGEGSSRNEMQRLAAEHGILDRFRFEPFVDQRLMPDYMNLADVVVMPSEREGLSRVYLEAQACGKTLIASDIPAAREVVIDDETGLLFAKGDLNDQAQATVRATSDPVLRAEIGARARRYVEQHHDIEHAVERYMTLVRGLAGRRDAMGPSGRLASLGGGSA